MLKIQIFLVLTLLFNSVFCQKEPQKDFQKTRKTDFTTLLGLQANFEGIKINYNTEKSYIEGTFGTSLRNSSVLLQYGGTFGTTTSISSLFNQPFLPTGSLYITANFLLNGSVWWYDGSFSRNYSQIQNDKIPIETISTNAYDTSSNGKVDTLLGKFRYRNSLREEVVAGKHQQTRALYTAKFIHWISLTTKYENSKYSFFDGQRAFNTQIYDTLYHTFSTKINYNAYLFWNNSDVKWNARPNFVYFTLYLKYDLSNNISQLKKAIVNDVIQTSTDPVTQTPRQVIKSQTSYQGLYKQFHTLNPGLEFIISPVKSVAVDLFGDYNFIGNSDKSKFNMKDYGNFGSGLYFYQSNNSSSNLNIGIFYKLVQNSENKWNGQYGIKTSIPISPL